jgi:hypothetical protein
MNEYIHTMVMVVVVCVRNEYIHTMVIVVVVVVCARNACDRTITICNGDNDHSEYTYYCPNNSYVIKHMCNSTKITVFNHYCPYVAPFIFNFNVTNVVWKILSA